MISRLACPLRRPGPPSRVAVAGLLVLMIGGRIMADDEDAKAVIVTVNGKPITAGDLEFGYMLRRVGTDDREKARKQVLEQLIDQRLMQEFLKDRKATVPEEEVAAQIARINTVIQRNGDEPANVLPKLGFTPERLKQEVTGMLGWTLYARRMIPDKQLREYWQAHKAELDGTQLRASHILIIPPAAADSPERKEAAEKLSSLRSEILAGKLTFAEAVKAHSQAASKANEGDVGFFPYRGKMPVEFTRPAFELKTGEISAPVQTPFGVHLIKVTERKAGDLSLEDVRSEVLQRVQLSLREEILRDLRGKAQIEWKTNEK
ncbi:MAG: peptidylprolyl isomerase [Planctomycetaceae bacterium]|nr:peptidylprolyl isomerase [Planctomycetaceae bacterium]